MAVKFPARLAVVKLVAFVAVSVSVNKAIHDICRRNIDIGRANANIVTAIGNTAIASASAVVKVRLCERSESSKYRSSEQCRDERHQYEHLDLET